MAEIQNSNFYQLTINFRVTSQHLQLATGPLFSNSLFLLVFDRSHKKESIQSLQTFFFFRATI